MSRSKMILGALAVSLLASAAAIDGALAQNQPAPAQGENGGGHPHFFSFLTPEERMMMFVQMHQATASMTDDQKQAYRQQQREKFMAMSDSDKQKFAADLQAKWNALPPDKQTEIKAQVDAYRAQRMQQMQGGGGANGGQ